MPLGSKILDTSKTIYSLDQLSTIYRTVDELIDGLDLVGIKELSGGNKNDLDNLMNTIVQETGRVLFSDQTPIKNGTLGYLEKLSESLDKTLKRTNLNYFTANVLAEFDINWHHIEWGNLVQLYKRLLIEAARDHSKSYHLSHVVPIWKMYRYQLNPSFFQKKENALLKKGMIVTNEYTLGKTLLGIIRETIEGNSELREILYPGSGEGWGKEEITCRNGCNLMIKSYGSRMRGFHPGWMIIDDFLNDSVLYSFEQREKYWNIFTGVILSMILPGGQIIVTGTPFVDGDMYDNIKKDPTFKCFEYPGIFPDGRVLWPGRYTYKDLMDKKYSLGSMRFSREILCKPISDTSSIFPYEILKRGYMTSYALAKNINSFPKKFERIIVGTDFGISSNIGSDYSAFVVVGVDGLDFWLLNIFRQAGMSYDYQIATLKAINENFRPDLFMIETNQMQKIFAQMGRDAGLPIAEHATGVDKYSFTQGLPAMAVLFEQGHIKIPRGDQESVDLTDMLAMELNSFTFDPDKKKLTSVVDHDDIGMALWQAIRGCKYVSERFSFSFV